MISAIKVMLPIFMRDRLDMLEAILIWKEKNSFFSLSLNLFISERALLCCNVHSYFGMLSIYIHGYVDIHKQIFLIVRIKILM